MTAAIAVLVVLAVAVDLACVAGVLAMPDVFGRLHYIGPASVAMLALAIAVILHDGASQLSVKSALIWAITAVAGPVSTHAIARAARVRQFGGWTVPPQERAGQ
jgi:monovalent cation/proton antiporter MnhG/PhaG subunit